MREIISFSSIPAPRFRYSPCVRTGPFYEFSGMIGLAADGRLQTGGVSGETRQILQNLLAAAAEAGLTLQHLVVATIYTTRFDEFAAINAVWEEFFDANTAPPARTSVGVAALPLNALVEMSFRFYRE
jgi:2-iminobutanoate/2-iminopropanoate deaminase